MAAQHLEVFTRTPLKEKRIATMSQDHDQATKLAKPTIASTWNGHPVRRDSQGRFHLTDMWKANGGAERNKPKQWLANNRTKALAAEITRRQNSTFESETQVEPVVTIRGGNQAGTWGCIEMAVAYAAHLDAAFYLWVIHTFLGVQQGAGPAATMTVHPSHIERVLGFALDDRLALAKAKLGEAFDARLVPLEAKLNEVLDSRLARLERQLGEALDSRLAPLERKLDQALATIAAYANRIGALESAQGKSAAPAKEIAKKRPAFRPRGAKRALLLRFVAQERRGLCPCCGKAKAVDPKTQALTRGAKVACFQRDAPPSALEDFWPVCAPCCAKHRKKDFNRANRPAFEAWRTGLRGWLIAE